MVISCFGLFALSKAIIQAWIKEIGLRKVPGATTKEILYLLTLSFVKDFSCLHDISAHHLYPDDAMD